MVEVKSVKVDNWGVFFLQKLQNFFNKTDYCDLTLQFKDNSQLKVHRLVLSACTDFFNVLETQYNVQDDILIMPKDLQADVVVPIVNFMYTGTLEFEVNMYPRLLKTAKDMNMTVLLKLLDAHKRTVGESLRQQTKAPVLLNKGAVANQRVTNTYSRPSAPQRTYTQRRPPQAVVKTVSPRGPYTVQNVKVKTEKSPVSVVRSIPSSSYIRKNLPEPVQLVARYAASGSVKGPSRFECSDDVNTEAFESSFDNISYESKPLITSKDDDDATFEKIKRSAAGALKRAYLSANSSIASPPEKKPNIEEMKEYSEAQRLRKEIVAQEADEEMDYYAEDFQNADDDDEDDNNAENTSGSVVIKSDSGGPVNHAKIISEVLKKYPHLVKNNKNIKLKILQKGNSPVTVSAITKDPSTIATSKQQAAAKQSKAITVQAKLPSKSEVTMSKVSTAPTKPAPAAQPKKIDSRTMHALIAKGAENMTGPWLCLECGVDGRPISIPAYKSFRRHLINVHRQKIDPRLCEHCGFRSNKRNDLHYHILIKHQIKPPADLQFPKCGLCTFIALDQVALRKHKEEDHQTQGQQLCIYCNKTFQKEIQLYTHMRNNHKERAQEDGVMDFSDDETYEDDSDKYVPNHPEASQSSGNETKIKVLSNIAIPTKGQFIIDAQGGNNVLVATSTENINLEPSSEAEGLSNVASGIATSLAVLDTNAHLEGNETYEEDLQSQYIEAAMADVHGEILKKEEEEEDVETKFITEEGSELELTAAQKAQLLEQLQGREVQLSDNVVMVLDAGYEQAADVNNTSAESMDVDGQSQESADDTVKNDDSTEDELASMENASVDDDSQQEVVQEQDASNDTEKTGDEKPANKLISALEGDWTEEDDETEEVTDKKLTKSHETIKTDEKVTVAPVKTKHTKRDDNEPNKTEKCNSDSAKNILEDWDSQEKFDEDSEKSVNEEKTDTDTKNEQKTTEIESKNGDKTEKKQSSQKNELKTLIASDWGDEDEEAF